MTPDPSSGIEIARAAEQLRQEQETFNLRKAHEDRWFKLRLAMGYSSVALLAVVLAVSSYILFHPTDYSGGVTTAASAALFVDAVGLVVSVWKGVLQPDSARKLAPVTKTKIAIAAPPKDKQSSLGDSSENFEAGTPTT